MNDLRRLWMGLRPGPDATRFLVREPKCLGAQNSPPGRPKHSSGE
jgi:hypothetical protein